MLIRESRADMGVEEICHIILIYLSYIFPTNAFDKYKLCISKNHLLLRKIKINCQQNVSLFLKHYFLLCPTGNVDYCARTL